MVRVAPRLLVLSPAPMMGFRFGLLRVAAAGCNGVVRHSAVPLASWARLARTGHAAAAAAARSSAAAPPSVDAALLWQAQAKKSSKGKDKKLARKAVSSLLGARAVQRRNSSACKLLPLAHLQRLRSAVCPTLSNHHFDGWCRRMNGPPQWLLLSRC